MTRPVHEFTPVRDQGGIGFRTSQLERKAAGDWIYVGTSTDPVTGDVIAPFTNGGNKGGRFQTLRFRWSIDGTLPEIQGVVAGVAPGDVIFTLPGLYVPSTGDAGAGDMPVAGVDPDTGLHVAFEVRANGDVVFVG